MCLIFHFIYFQISDEYGPGDLFSVINLAFDLEFIVYQEFIHIAQLNDRDKLTHLPFLGEGFFKRETSLAIVVVLIYIIMDVVVPVFHFAILKLN